MTGSLQRDWKRYHNIYGRFYHMACSYIVYVPYLSVNIFSATRELSIRLNINPEKETLVLIKYLLFCYLRST